MAFEIPAFPYAYNALEPYIDAQTVELHYSKHHATYLKNLNTALEKYPAVLRPHAGRDLLKDLNQRPGRYPHRRAQ